MITSKQRAALRSAANGLPAWFQVGKGGVTENMLADVSAALDAHELVKLTVLKTAGISAKEAIVLLSEAAGRRHGQQGGHIPQKHPRGR